MQELGRIGRLDVDHSETGGVGAYLKFFDVVAESFPTAHAGYSNRRAPAAKPAYRGRKKTRAEKTSSKTRQKIAGTRPAD